MKKLEMTREEKEMLRAIMEDDELCKRMEFYRGVDWEVPPAETFMVGEPDLPEKAEYEGEKGIENENRIENEKEKDEAD